MAVRGVLRRMGGIAEAGSLPGRESLNFPPVIPNAKDSSPSPTPLRSPPDGATAGPWWRVAGQWFAFAGRLLRERVGFAVGGLAVIGLASYALSFADPAAKAWVTTHQEPELRAIGETVSHWGKLHLAPAIALAALGAAGLVWKRREWLVAAGSGALAAAVAGILVQVLKAIFGRPRPYVEAIDGFYWFKFQAAYHSFPSGHALHCFAIVGAVAVLAPRLSAALAVLAVAVTFSRFYVVAHYPSDLLAGALLGLGIGVLFGLAGRKWLTLRKAAGASIAVEKGAALERWAPWLLIAVVLLVLLPGTGTAPLIDRDEPRFATATREMIERGDWFVPTFNGADRFDKPVLTYWLMRAGYALAGVGELGARLHSVAAALVLVLTTWMAGRRWFGVGVGWLAGFGLATCLQFFVHGRLALADMPMVAAVALACLALAELMFDDPETKTPATNPAARRRRHWRWWWTLYLSLAVGFLAKGPIALAVPVLALVLMRWVCWRRPLPWARLRFGWGLLLVLALVACWGVPALLRTHGRFATVGLGEHVVQRGFENFNNRAYSLIYYLKTAPLSLFPWIALVGMIGLGLRRAWSQRNAWLVSWLVAPYLIFTAYATQLPHYVLPAFPAFFLLLGQGVETARAGGGRRWSRIVAEVGLVFVFGIIGAAAVVVLGTNFPAAAEPLRWGLIGTLAVLGGLALLPVGWLRRWWWLVGIGVVGVAAGGATMAAGLRAVAPSIRVAGQIAAAPTGARRVGFGFAEPSLVFYGGSRWTFVETGAELAAEIARPGPVIVVALVREGDPLGFFTGKMRWHDGLTPAGLEGWKTTDCSGMNLGRTRWQELRIYQRE